MIDLEKQKQHFKNHIASFTDYGNVKILDFKNPKSSEYRIRFMFEEDYYRLHISGDLGELVATNYYNMTYDKFSDFVNDIGYFEEKIDCHSRAIYFYDEDKARKDIVKYLKEYGLCCLIAERYDSCFYDEDEAVDAFVDDVLEYFDERTGISSTGFEKLSLIDYCAYEWYKDCGKDESGILELYMLAFKLAQDDLRKQESTKTENQCDRCINADTCESRDDEVIEMIAVNLDGEDCKLFKDKSDFVKLPCKVGDTVYQIDINNGKPEVNERVVRAFYITKHGIHFVFCIEGFGEYTTNENEKVFFSREDAEQTLKRWRERRTSL